MLRRYKQSNPNSGLIGGVTCERNEINSVPIVEKACGVPHKLIPAVRNLMKKFVQEEVLQKSTSRYNSPTFVIRKPNGELRLLTNL